MELPEEVKSHTQHEPAMTQFLLRYRRVLLFAWYLALGAASYFGAFLLRFEGHIPADYYFMLLVTLPVVLAVKGFGIYRYGLPRGLLRYANMEDLMAIVKAATLSTMGIVVGVLVFHYGRGFPRSIFFIDYILTIALYGATRLAFRFSGEFLQRPAKLASPGRRTLIIGAGDAGDMALHAIKKDFVGILTVVGFLDDDPMKAGMMIHGYPILGTLDDAPRIIKERAITEVIIAITTASKERVREIVDTCASRNVNFQILPTFKEYIDGKLDRQSIRRVRVEDLLGREPIVLDKSVVTNDLDGKCVLVTGAGGSIGSELVRQIATFKPAKLILLDAAETPLFEIDRELAEKAPDVERVCVFANIKHGDVLDQVFRQYQPHRIYHAAAYKHVPLMEAHPVEAVFNNVLGTRSAAEAAVRNKVEKFVMISTDKAVRPTSVMGATKRCAELLVSHMNGRGTRFVTVRFGNVLASTGSVVPIFQKQIAQGGPIKVTHPEVSRFFMTIPEAVELVLQAGAIGEGGEVFILDMGKQIKIADLARSMVELSGLEVGKDIEIEYAGLRPGEKLSEELVAYGEHAEETSIPKVMVHRSAPNGKSGRTFLEELKPLEEAAMACDNARVVKELWAIVKRHDPDLETKKGLEREKEA